MSVNLLLLIVSVWSFSTAAPYVESTCTTLSVTSISNVDGTIWGDFSAQYGLHLHVSIDLQDDTRDSHSCTLREYGRESGNVLKAILLKEKYKLFLSVVSTHNAHNLITLLTAGGTLEYSCNNDVTTCLRLRAHKNNRLTKRSTDETEQSHASYSTHKWVWSIVGIAMGVVTLTLVGVLCVKSTQQQSEELQPQSKVSTLRILSGPPPEYLTPPPPPPPSSQSDIVSTEEAILHIDGPSSPSPLSFGERERSSTSSPDHGQHPRKKLVTPLPDIPKLTIGGGTGGQQDEDEDEQNESPYDYAKFDGHEQRNSNSLPSNSKTPPPSYAVVSRLPELNQNTCQASDSYSEIRQMGVASRGRSVTDPVEPPPLLSPLSLPRTYTEGASHLPLPLPPRNFTDRDDTYDSIENVNSQKLYDSVDNKGDNEMYESVSEDFKEEILSSSAPLRNPFFKFSEASSSGSPSPTKSSHPNGDSIPDSPTGRKFLKHQKENRSKPRAESTSGDEERHRISFFNRIRSSSTSAAVTTGRKRHDLSPDHGPPTLPPLPPQPHFTNEEEDEDDDDMYDSVRVRPFLLSSSSSSSSPSSKVSTLPANMRPSLFNPRINEPLPEVPEDSGSGSSAVIVKRDRVHDRGDPNYDTVNPAHHNEEQEHNYDTVQRDLVRKIEGGAVGRQNEGRGGGHNYAKVTSHMTTDDDCVDHDNLGYAIVDPSIIERKRVFSFTQKEHPYDKITTTDKGYSSVKDILGGVANTPPTDVIDIPPSNSMAVVNEAPPTDSSPPLEDTAYAIIDPKIIQRKRAASIKKTTEDQMPHQTLGVQKDRPHPPPSPVPSLPHVGYRGDLSEFDPPPIPDHFPDELSPDECEPPYAKVGSVAMTTENDTPTHTVTRVESGEPRPSTSVQRESVHSMSPPSDGVPVYDSLEPQQPLYDSLGRKDRGVPQVQPIYDCLLPTSDDEQDNVDITLI